MDAKDAPTSRFAGVHVGFRSIPITFLCNVFVGVVCFKQNNYKT